MKYRIIRDVWTGLERLRKAHRALGEFEVLIRMIVGFGLDQAALTAANDCENI